VFTERGPKNSLTDVGPIRVGHVTPHRPDIEALAGPRVAETAS